jgi:hypothetical protein
VGLEREVLMPCRRRAERELRAKDLRVVVVALALLAAAAVAALALLEQPEVMGLVEVVVLGWLLQLLEVLSFTPEGAAGLGRLPEPQAVQAVAVRPILRGPLAPLALLAPLATLSTLATLARIDESATSDLPMVPTIENEEQARRVRVGLKLIDEHIKAKVEAWKTALHEYVSRNGPVDLGGGKWYGAVEKSRDVLGLRHEHLDLMKRIMGDDAATAAIEIATSKAAIEKALKERQTKRGEGIAKSRELYDALRSVGAMRRSRGVVFSDFKRRNDDSNDDNDDSNDDEGEAA